MASGSRKEMAKQYEVTYPTVRLRLDKLIQKIQVSDSTESEPYITLIKKLAIDDKLDIDTEKILIDAYKKVIPQTCIELVCATISCLMLKPD